VERAEVYRGGAGSEGRQGAEVYRGGNVAGRLAEGRAARGQMREVCRRE